MSQGYAALDTVGIEYWLKSVLAGFAARGPVGRIVPVAHGAAAALIRDGRLRCAPMDYEWAGPAEERATYDAQRDVFAASGSPALPGGLNLGRQLHWLESLGAGVARGTQIVPWAQYWAWVLSGVAASEVTSLGCHTDLWRPYSRSPSGLAQRRGWADRLAPMHTADAVLGTLAKDWVEHTGLSPRVEIFCGLHDSNAALLAARGHTEVRERDLTVLSTGTWFVAMRSPLRGAHSPPLPEGRDCLVNVDVEGTPVPSARFMGGREIDILTGQDVRAVGFKNAPRMGIEAALRAIEAGEMIFPSVVPGVGPYPHGGLMRSKSAAHVSDPLSLALLYAALMADVSLDLIGSGEWLIVEGRFSQEPVFTRALASLRPQTRLLISADDNGVAQGALSLVGGHRPAVSALERVAPLPINLGAYRSRWREVAKHAERAA
jgi:sugar (pentulose or hexulose) kinase